MTKDAIKRETRTLAELVAEYGGSPRKPYNNCAGYRTSRRNPISGGFLTIYDAEQAGMGGREDGGRWCVVCETHGTLVHVSSMLAARRVLYSGATEFCDDCRELEARQ